MILEALGNLGDFIGGIAIVVTLIYLALQVRQNTAALRTASRQEIVSGFRDFVRSYFNPAAARAYAKGAQANPNMTFEERNLFGIMMTDHATFFQGAFALHESGQLEEETYRAYLEWFAIQVSTPGGSAWWDEVGRSFLAPRRMIDAIEARLARGQVPDISGTFLLRLDESSAPAPGEDRERPREPAA
jgi:hypothetical protein